MDEKARATLLRDQIMKTWNPPLSGMGCVATVAQTSAMQTMAFVFGPEFLPNLSFEQTSAIDGGLALMNAVLTEAGGGDAG